MKLIVIILTIIASYFTLLPLKDRRDRKRGFPWMTLTLVVLNVLIFIVVNLILSRYSEKEALKLLHDRSK